MFGLILTNLTGFAAPMRKGTLQDHILLPHTVFFLTQRMAWYVGTSWKAPASTPHITKQQANFTGMSVKTAMVHIKQKLQSEKYHKN